MVANAIFPDKLNQLKQFATNSTGTVPVELVAATTLTIIIFFAIINP